VVVFVVVEGLLLFIILRYRHREGAPTPKPTHGHTVMEIAWTLAPALILVFIAVPTMRTIFATQSRPPEGALRVEVVGHQWWWEFRYPELGVVTANEAHLPRGRPVVFELSSVDVIHSFWAPALGGKRDVIPGHINRIVLRPDSVGVFLGQCAEFCGASHANMRLRVMVDSDSGFRAWVAGQQAGAAAVPKGSPADHGQQAFMRYGCIGCHTMGTMSNAKVGPVLTHVGSRSTIAGGIFPNDSTHLARWIADPPGVKPGAIMPNMHVPPAELAALVAYLQSMK
jgi:cytochrome c oxidase subunit 2